MGFQFNIRTRYDISQFVDYAKQTETKIEPELVEFLNDLEYCYNMNSDNFEYQVRINYDFNGQLEVNKMYFNRSPERVSLEKIRREIQFRKAVDALSIIAERIQLNGQTINITDSIIQHSGFGK